MSQESERERESLSIMIGETVRRCKTVAYSGVICGDTVELLWRTVEASV